jgi:hypothetical protein
VSNGDEGPCPICSLEHAKIYGSTARGIREIICKRCGKFEMEGILRRLMEGGEIEAEDKPLLPYLSAHTRQATQQGIVTKLDRQNWRDLARAHTTTPVSRKVTKLLEFIASCSTYPGARVVIDADHDYPLLDAVGSREVIYLLNHLKNLHCLQGEGGSFSLTVEGWARLEPPAGGGGIPGRCFIAMSFDPSLNDAYTLGIEPAVRNCGFNPIRIDRVHHNEKICDKILAEVRLCQFLVADFTLHRGGVYFEAGFAMGLGRSVIWMCREDDLKNTHFDTRQYNHVVWSTPEDLRAKLADRIRATIR